MPSNGPYSAQIQRAIAGLTSGNTPWTGSITPATTNTYDLGTSALKWRTGYFGTSVVVGGATLTNSAGAVLSNAGSIEAAGGTSDVTAGRDVYAGAGRYVGWSGSTLLGAPSAGVFQFWNWSANSGLRLDVATANNVAAWVSTAGADTATLKANTINATGKFQINGVNGFTGTGIYTTLTINNGIITAAS